MSGIPADIPDVGSTGQKLSQNPAFDAVKAGLSTEDYFVWSRFDGATTLRDLLLMTGFPVDRSVSIVQRLRQLGAILLPGEDPSARRPAATTPRAPAAPPAGARRPTTAPPPVRPAPRPPSGSIPPPEAPEEVTLADPTPDERTALDEPGDLSERERLRILVMYRRLATGDSHVLLGVASGAERRDLKRSYFRLSKDFHPDRYYARQLGSFGARLSAIFEALAHAYAQLTEVPGRAVTESPGRRAAEAQAQTPGEHAGELFDRGCALEVAGDPASALRLFDAAIRVDPQARYLRRAAACAIAAQSPRVAEEYARKAASLEPSDPSTQRLLAHAFKASGRFADAEEVLLMAMQLKNENDVLAKELRTDLAEVRRLLARSAGY